MAKYRTPFSLHLFLVKFTALGLGLAAALIGVDVAGSYVVSGLLITICLGFTVLLRSKGRISKKYFTAVDLWFSVFIALIVGMEVWNSLEMGHPVNMGTILFIALCYVSSWVARSVVCRRDDLLIFIRWFSVAVIAVSSIAVMQIVNLPGINHALASVVSSGGLQRRVDSGWDIRATSTIGHWTGLGGYCGAICALACVDLCIRKAYGLKRALISYTIILFSLVGVLSTVTFAVIGLAFVVLGFTLRRIGVRLSILLVSVAVIGFAVPFVGEKIANRLDQQSVSSETSSSRLSYLPGTVAYRVLIWTSETLPTCLERPFTGWGYGVYDADANGWVKRPMQLQWISPESEWFRTWISAGIFSLVAEILLLLACWRFLNGDAFKRDHLDMMPLRVFFIVLILVSCFHDHLSSVGASLVLWPFIGALIGCQIAWRSERRQQSGDYV